VPGSATWERQDPGIGERGLCANADRSDFQINHGRSGCLVGELVAFGNITDYGTNLAFVIHVLSMDTLFSGTTIRYRAITSQALHHAAYNLIIAAEAIAATFCWIAAFRMFRSIPDPAAFTRAKTLAVVGLTTCLLIWLVGFIAIGGEWFGMWMSERWNGIQSAFRFSALVLGTLIFVIAPDSDPTE
jgi:predicted small integral membrane protein